VLLHGRRRPGANAAALAPHPAESHPVPVSRRPAGWSDAHGCSRIIRRDRREPETAAYPERAQAWRGFHATILGPEQVNRERQNVVIHRGGSVEDARREVSCSSYSLLTSRLITRIRRGCLTWLVASL
jgi:hypothetical protein